MSKATLGRGMLTLTLQVGSAVGGSGPGLGFTLGKCSYTHSAMFLSLLLTLECFGSAPAAACWKQFANISLSLTCCNLGKAARCQTLGSSIRVTSESYSNSSFPLLQIQRGL